MDSVLSLIMARLRGMPNYLQIYLVSCEVELQLCNKIRVLWRVPVVSVELTKMRIS